MSLFAATLAAVLSISRVVLAHPGHGVAGGSYSFWHYLSEPAHITVAAVFVITGLVALRLRQGWKAPQN